MQQRPLRQRRAVPDVQPVGEAGPVTNGTGGQQAQCKRPVGPCAGGQLAGPGSLKGGTPVRCRQILHSVEEVVRCGIVHDAPEIDVAAAQHAPWRALPPDHGRYPRPSGVDNQGMIYGWQRRALPGRQFGAGIVTWRAGQTGEISMPRIVTHSDKYVASISGYTGLAGRHRGTYNSRPRPEPDERYPGHNSTLPSRPGLAR